MNANLSCDISEVYHSRQNFVPTNPAGSLTDESSKSIFILFSLNMRISQKNEYLNFAIYFLLLFKLLDLLY